ncbi:hypothetical protein ACWDD9_31190 [Kitasatospora sp. NPDC001119]
MTTEPPDLYDQLCTVSPANYRTWISSHIPEDTHLQTWGAVNDLLKTDAIYALADPKNHPREHFDRAVEFAIAAIESGRVPAFMGINWLGVYVSTADRFGWVIEHPELAPDNLGRRILALLSPARIEVLKFAEHLRVEGWRQDSSLGPDRDTWSAIRSVRLELEWAAPRMKDSRLATAAKEWLELIWNIEFLTDRTS